jgi:hypothetical protein
MMIISAFAGFMMRGGNEASRTAPSDVSVQTFGIPGTLLEMDFNKIDDLLYMSPESTVTAYWIDLGVSDNLTQAAREALPQAIGLMYGSSLYQKNREARGIVLQRQLGGVPLGQALSSGLQQSSGPIRWIYDDTSKC